MPKKLSIDPVTRIEGHLAIETSIGDGVVTGARVAGRMYRGFEQLLIGRHPIDAARITQRICGICHEVHGIAASIALEDLYNITPTANGLVLRDLILGLHLVTDHIFHFYQLTLPDYVDFSLLQKYEGKDRRVASLKQMFGNSDAFAGQKLNDAIVESSRSWLRIWLSGTVNRSIFARMPVAGWPVSAVRFPFVMLFCRAA